MSEVSFSWKDHVPATFSSILFISQIIVGAYLLSEVPQNEVLAYIGVGLYVFSGMIFGALPVFVFRKKGGVRKGAKLYSHNQACRYWNILYCSPSPVCHFHDVGNRGSSSFSTLDCYLPRNSYFPSYIR